MPGAGAPGEAGPGLQGRAALCHPPATEPELPGDTAEAQHKHPGEGEPDPLPTSLRYLPPFLARARQRFRTLGHG